MAEKEMQAHDNLRRKNFLKACQLYDQILTTPNNNDRLVILLGRSECFLELKKFESCVQDCLEILSILGPTTDYLTSFVRTKRKLIYSYYKLDQLEEAETVLDDCIKKHGSIFGEMINTLERYKTCIQELRKESGGDSDTRLADDINAVDKKLDHWVTNNLTLDKFTKLLTNKGNRRKDLTGICKTSKSNELLNALKSTSGKIDRSNSEILNCSYCSMNFESVTELRLHCQTDNHQKIIMSDEGREWKWRPPPRGYSADSYAVCDSFMEFKVCQYGNQCVEAHGTDELEEWKERFEYRKMRLKNACDKELYGKTYTEQLLERWGQSTRPDKIMCEKVSGIEEFDCSTDLKTSISSKISTREWTFNLRSKKSLKAVALLDDTHRDHFKINCITMDGEEQSYINLKSDQEYVTSIFFESEADIKYSITIGFTTDIYGTFRQSVCFDFNEDPILVKHFCVDVVPVEEAGKIEEIRNDIINSSSQRWDESNTNLTKYEATIPSHLRTKAYMDDLMYEKELIERFPCPRPTNFALSQSTIMEKRLTELNYRSRMHELLYVEEIARYEQISKFNVSTKINVASSYTLMLGSATSTVKFSHSGELFGILTLGKDLSEDTSAGRLILSNCSTVYLSAFVNNKKTIPKDDLRSVYECTIEDKGKNIIYLKISSKCVQALNLKSDMDILVDIQFQLNRLTYCEWHNAIDKITNFRLLFPNVEVETNIPWTPKKQWTDSLAPRLNAKQKEAVNAITAPIEIKLPPILLIGPFGTGKTYTLAQAIKLLLQQPEAKILICTHSNSAADLYIKDYLHPWVSKGMKEATPLRVYYHKRWVQTVTSVVQKYCIIDSTGMFRRPTVEDIVKHRIVVVTLNISMELSQLDLPKGYFTHIFLDEAAQAIECESIMPLSLANENTRIVLAGDHMQMSPELFSDFAKERNLQISLLERLYIHYPPNFPCKILLCENYRAHEAIIKFTSELFYEQKLIASGKQPRHDRFYPLTFFTTRGEDLQESNSTAFYNNAEVYELVERVSELRKKWPASWGKINDASIGIMTPYADQVFRIRSELRKRRMGGISVERVLNVQGKQFRVVFLSTVRTRRTTTNKQASTSVNSEDVDYGFLSNSKLLNTAITRAQSLVAVVGDPIALCSIGRCRKVWERFIEICHQNKSLFGLTWSNLRSQLDGVEFKRTYVLNPLAPEFIPRALQPEAYLRDQAAAAIFFQHQMKQHMHLQNQHPIQHHYNNNQISNMYPQHGYPPTSMGPTGFSHMHLQTMQHLHYLPQFGMTRHVPPQPQPKHATMFSPYGIGKPNQTHANPNASIWGPPPQTNPWGVINKQHQTQTPSPGGPGPPTVLPSLAAPATPQQQQTYAKKILQFQQQQQMYSNFKQTLNTPSQINQQEKFQFLNNVHNIPLNVPGGYQLPVLQPQTQHQIHQNYFPQQHHQHSSLIQSHQQQQQQQTLNQSQPFLGFPSFNEYSGLLPSNMQNFYEMAAECKEVQYGWYLKLLECYGQEAANKYTEVLKQVRENIQIQQQKNFYHKMSNSNHMIQTNQIAPDSNLNQQIDMVFNTLMHGNATQPILRDVLGASTNNSNLENNILNLHINASPVPSLASSKQSSGSNFLQMQPSNQSVPLYRRQVIGSGSNSGSNSQSTSTPDNFQHESDTMHFMDSLFNNKFAFDCNSLSSSSRRSQTQSKGTTYADVLNQQNSQHLQNHHQQQQQQVASRSSNDKDPFSAIRELCQKPNELFNNHF